MTGVCFVSVYVFAITSFSVLALSMAGARTIQLAISGMTVA